LKTNNSFLVISNRYDWFFEAFTPKRILNHKYVKLTVPTQFIMNSTKKIIKKFNSKKTENRNISNINFNESGKALKLKQLKIIINVNIG